jgi:hypothetical protein
MTKGEFSDVLNNRRLSFFDSNLERKFTKNKQGFQMISLRVLCLTIVTQSSAIFYSNPLQIDLMQPKYIFLHLFSVISVLLLGFLIHKKKPHLSSLGITTIVISFIIGASEGTKIIFVESDWTPGMQFVLGMNFQTGCLFLILSRIRWTYNLISLTVLQVYIWLRGLDYEKNPTTQKPALVTLFVYLAILPYFCYAGELEDRKIFANIEKLQNYQKGYEELLRDVIPSSIIMVQKGKINFFNKKTKEMFLIDHQDDIQEIFTRLTVIKIRKNYIVNASEFLFTQLFYTLRFFFKPL